MDFPGFDAARVARSLAALADGDEAVVDAFFEQTELVESSTAARGPGVILRREGGFALRLQRGESLWQASSDRLDADALRRAFRRVARVMPQTPPVFDRLALARWDEESELEQLREFPGRVQRALRERRVAFPLELLVRRHRRRIQVVGPRLLPEAESEQYYSVEARTPAGAYGTLISALEGADTEVARALAELFRARDAAPPEDHSYVVVLAPAAAAVLMHEVVAHTLEADNLARSGRPASAVGLQLSSSALSLLDDPGGAPPGVARRTDDEGIPVRRRWLLRDGVVEEPLADRYWAEREAVLQPGSGRRGSRHELPLPRVTHLELLPGQSSSSELLADAPGGLFIEEFERGRLDPCSGTYVVEAAWGRRIDANGLGARVGRLVLRGSVSVLLDRVAGIGDRSVSGGAGWCAKGGRRVPVWANAASLRLEGVEVSAS